MAAFEDCLNIFSEAEHNYASFMNKAGLVNLQKYADLIGVDNPLDLCIRKMEAK